MPVSSPAQSFTIRRAKWTFTGDLNVARYGHTATLLLNGKSWSSGAIQITPCLTALSCTTPVTATWEFTGNLNAARLLHSAVLLPSGKVLVAGGLSETSQPLGSSELYDPATGQWSNTGSLNTVRAVHTATLLNNGKVLVVGGEGCPNSDGFLATVILVNEPSYTIR